VLGLVTSIRAPSSGQCIVGFGLVHAQKTSEVSLPSVQNIALQMSHPLFVLRHSKHAKVGGPL
jgi:hypothetical protein